MENANFQITKITRILERSNCIGWHMENIYYEDEYVLTIILDGETSYQMNQNVYSVKKNDILLFSPKVCRSGKTSTTNPWSFIHIVFRMQTNDPALSLINQPMKLWENGNDFIRQKFKEVARAWTSQDPLHLVKCQLLTTEILYDLFLSDMPFQKIAHSKQVAKAREIIQDNFRSDLSVEELAESLDLSVSYFRRLFKEAYGYSPMQYIMSLRIENAKNLLLSGEVNVTEAAQLSGFDDIYYFSTLFKKKTGYTPIHMLRKG